MPNLWGLTPLAQAHDSARVIGAVAASGLVGKADTINPSLPPKKMYSQLNKWENHGKKPFPTWWFMALGLPHYSNC